MSVRSDRANKVSELSRENLTLRNQLEEFEKSQDKRIDEIFCEFLTVLDTFERAEQTIKERELDKDETTKKAINRLLNAKKKAEDYASALNQTIGKALIISDQSMVNNPRVYMMKTAMRY